LDYSRGAFGQKDIACHFFILAHGDEAIYTRRIDEQHTFAIQRNVAACYLNRSAGIVGDCDVFTREKAEYNTFANIWIPDKRNLVEGDFLLFCAASLFEGFQDVLR
jgi:hypothetical protein